MHKILSNLHVIRPPYELDQENILEWIAAAHAEAAQQTSVGVSVLNQLKKVGLGKGKIAKRGLSIADCLHRRWKEMEIYKEGLGLGCRTTAFDQIATQILAQFYPIGTPLPSQLVHVTCTGYSAPSAAQKIVSLRDAGSKTTVTHVYHMGCNASIPAVRIALGLEGSTDIVHTEICSLHMNPFFHSLEQLVIQSLFGDGFIKYSVSQDPTPGFEILATQEEILPDSMDIMTWSCDDWGMRMTLSKDIPLVIAKALPSFVAEILKKADVCEDDSLYFAIHPGGPKIIEQIAALMKLEPWQFYHSAKVLKEYGNMSSATLPHIWNEMWKDKTLTEASKVVSLAFGPGLTVAGAVLQCRR